MQRDQEMEMNATKSAGKSLKSQQGVLSNSLSVNLSQGAKSSGVGGPKPTYEEYEKKKKKPDN